MKKIQYKDAINLGFERHQMDDSAFQDYHGYDDFYVELEISKKYAFIWTQENDFVELRKMKGSDIISTLRIYELSELQTLVNFFNCTEKGSVFSFKKDIEDDYGIVTCA
jgi:hypothetical protein